MKNHKTLLKDLMQKSGEYPIALRDAKSILVEEQSNLIPTYMDGGYVSFLEARVIDAEKEEDDFKTKIEQKKAINEIDDFRGNINNFVYGMDSQGVKGYPNLMVMTNDLDSQNPAIIRPEHPQFSFEIKPKEFNLGLTGRILEDEKGQKYNEHLFVELNIYDAFDLAKEIHPNRVFALTKNDESILVYEKEKYNIGQIKKFSKREQKYYVMSEESRKNWMCETEVLPTNGLKVISNDFYERIKQYYRGTFMFGHKFKDIDEFLSFATLTDNHLIWKICKKEKYNPNRPLIDCEPVYGKYKGETRYESVNRLHFMPHKASLSFDGTMIPFDRQVCIKALMDLGDVVRDIWIDPISVRGYHYGDGCQWDIIYDQSRGINPENPVTLNNDFDYKKYSVLKE